MKKNDSQIYEMLRNELDSIEIPESIRKENIVKMLKEQKDFSDKTGNIIDFDAKRDNASKKNIAVIGKITAMAAALAIIIAGALFINGRSKVDVIKTKPAYENNDAAKLIRGAESYDDVEQAIQQILNKPSADSGEASTENGEPATSGNSGNSQTGGYVAQPIENTDKNESLLIDVEEFTGFEADIVKNNGEYLFIVATEDSNDTSNQASQVIKTVKAFPASEMSVVSTIILADNSNPNIKDKCIEIYLKDNRLVAIMERKSSLTDDAAAYNKDLTVAIYYDITNPEAPQKLREHVQDGKYITSYLSNNTLCLITDKPIVASENMTIPSYSVNGVLQMPEAEEIFMAVNDPEAAYVFITTTNIADFSVPVSCIAFLGGSGNGLYVCENSVIVTRSFISVEADENGNHKKLSEIYRFDISEESTSFAGSYAVNGTLSDAPFVDSKNGNIIVAATDASSTSIYVLDKKMQLVGSLDGIFRNQKIKNVLYLGSTCYVTSGAETEITAIIDLSNPSKPVEKATVSTEGLANTFYKAGEGVFFRIIGKESNGLILSLLNLNSPDGLANSIDYNLDGISDCEIPADSKSVMVIGDKKIFGIPVVSKDKKGCAYALFDFSNGSINPIGYFGDGLEFSESHTVRGTCIGDTLYIVSGDKIAAFSINTESEIASIELN